MGWSITTFSGQRAVGSGQKDRRESDATSPAAPLLPTAHCPPPTSEAGFTLAALIVLITIISMIVAYTVPQQWSMVMARERDRQTIFVMKQYARAIDQWEKKHQSLPANLEQLEKARNPRYVRGDGELECPLTGKYEWIMVPPGAVQPGGQAPPGTPGAGYVPGQNRSMNPSPSNPYWNQQNQPGQSQNPATNPQANPNQPNPQQTGTGAFNAAASPKDYVGPFVGVRPAVSGKSFLALNGAEDYSQWVYTIYDLRQEILNQQNAIATSK